MSFLIYFQRCNKLVRMSQKNATHYLNDQVKFSFHILKCTYCCNAELNAQNEDSLNKRLPYGTSQTEVNAVDDENEFGKLKRSLESVKTLEKIKKVESIPKVTSNNNRPMYREKSHTSIKFPTNRAKSQSLDFNFAFSNPAKTQSSFENTFGDLSDSNSMWYTDINEEPKQFTDPNDDSIIVIPGNKKFSAKEYLSEMKILVKEKKLKQALELFLDMKRNYIQPIHANYTYMIGACGKAGYTDMAFKLLRQMTDIGLQPTPATLTGLFNSCAQSPFPDIGLKKAQLLKDKIEQKNWLATQPTYHAMIKAFGKCGDIQTAFQIVDEMAKADIKINVSTYSFLLMSCAAEKEAGFTHAIEVWRKMKARRIRPNIFTYNLLLRTVRDCGVGPEEVSSMLLQHWSSYAKRPYGLGIDQISSKKDFLKLTSAPDYANSSSRQEPLNEDIHGNSSGIGDRTTTSSENINEPDQVVESFVEKTTDVMKFVEVPSLLRARPLSGAECINLANIIHPSDKLALVGGVNAFLKSMVENKINPDIKTFTLLLESIPPSTASEEDLLMLLKTYKVQPDIDFFNILIKKRNLRKNVTAGRNTLVLITRYGLTPDIVTFGVLALGCLNRKLATSLLSDMEKLDICPNIEIIGALIHNSTETMDFKYMEDVLRLMIDKDIKPNEKVMLMIENAVQSARNNIIDMEHGKDVDLVFRSTDFTKKFKQFCSYYENWSRNIGFEVSQHPWLQYKTEITEKVLQEDL